MRWLPVTFLVAACSIQAQSRDIVDVLRQSQQSRLDAMPAAPPGPRAETVRASFETLRQRLPPGLSVELRVVSGGVVAETLQGHVVVANEALAELTEGERLFVLGHELGHVLAGHWNQLGAVYKRWIPGEVTPDQTDPVAGALGREASALSHRQEFEADEYGLRFLKLLGRPSEDAYSAFLHLGMTQDTATHPGTRKRVAALHAAEAPVADLGSGR